MTPYSYSVTGPFAGGFVGGNYQFDQFVVGVEGDWQRSNLTGNNEQQAAIGAAWPFRPPRAPSPAARLRFPPRSKTTNLSVAGSASRSIGFWFSVLPAGHGAILRMPTPFSVPLHSSVTAAYSHGWTVGAGLDYAFTDHVFGRFEYRYTDLGLTGFVNAAANVSGFHK